MTLRSKLLETEDIGEITVVVFTDGWALNDQSIQIVGEQLFALVDVLGKKKILLRWHNIEHLAAAALGKIITLNRKVNSAGGKLILSEINPEIYEVFEITKLNKLLSIEKTYQEALKAF